MWKRTFSANPARMLAAVAAGVLIVSLLINYAPALAIASGAPKPGTSFDTASSLGLTYPGAKANYGIKLDGSTPYYFTFTLEAPSNVSFWFSGTQRPSTTSGGVLGVYSSGRRSPRGTAQSVSCPSGLFCYGGISYSNLAAGTYYLTVDMGTFAKLTGSGAAGWLTWKADKFGGDQPGSALAWYNRTDLYGQMPGETRSQWYKVNMGAGQRGSLKLYGDNGSNLNVYLYSDSSTSRAFASGTLTRYPESFSFTVPSGARGVYIQVENAGKGGSEYTIQLGR